MTPSTQSAAILRTLKLMARFIYSGPSIAGAVGGGLGEHALQVAAAPEGRHAGSHLGAVLVVARRAQADGAEHFLDLALRECVAPRQLLSERLGAVAAADLTVLSLPAEQGVVAGQTPAVLPVVVGRDVAGLEVVRIDEVLRLHLALRVDQAALRRVEVVVRERLRQRVHAAVTADAVVQEDAA